MLKVICAHPFATSNPGNDCNIYHCPTCNSEWVWEVPEVVIGYVKEENS